jgi:two-component system, sensor histidine kinase and response regulator
MQRDDRRTKAELLEEIENLRSYIGNLSKACNNNADYHEFIFDTMIKTFVENTADGVIVSDFENKTILTSNSKMCRMLGYDSEQLTKLRQEDMYPKEQLPYILEEIGRRVNTKGLVSVNIPVLRKDGSIFYADINSFHVLIAGKSYGMVFFRDVTDRKNTETELKNSEEKFRSLTTNIPGMVYRVRPDWSVDLVTYSRNICGYSPQEFYSVQIKWLDLIHPLDKDRIFTEGSQLLRTRGSITQRYRIVTKSGDVRWVEDHKISVVDSQGVFSGVDGVAFDITERENMEDALFDERNKLQTILEIMKSGVSIRDLEYNVVFENVYMNRFFGSHIGRKCYQAYKGQDKICENCPVELAYRDGTSHTETLKSLVLPSGEISYWESTANPIRDADGNITSCLVVNVDITERKKAQDELNKFREEMTRAEQIASIGTLSAIAAHELTQPLTVIRLLIENIIVKIQASKTMTTVVEELKDSLTEISNITSVVDRLRHFARISTNRNIIKVNLGAVADRIVNLLRESAQEAAIELHLEKMDSLPSLYLYEKDMEQMFFSLITNSIQAAHGRKNCRLIISAEVKDGFIELQFRDNCGGIEPKNIEKIYEPFFTTKPEGMGTGLGLSIVQDVVSRAGGNVRVESEFGKGATFFVTLPIKKYQ